MKDHISIIRFTTLLVLVFTALVVASCGATTQPEATSEPEAVPLPEADLVRGGLLYDEWWAVGEAEGHEEQGEGEEEHEAAGPTTDNPLWATQTANTRSGADTWRCKECHGWDYKGFEGAYGEGSHFTGFPGVLTASDKSFDEILGALKGETNPDHDFSTVMDEQDLIDLSLFISQGLIDDDEILNDDGTSTGDAAVGEERFTEVCSKCHGPDGNAINFADLSEPEFLGHVAADNPWEFVHKVRFGQRGWPMPSAISNEWSLEDVANVLAYAQTLPTEPALSGGGPLYDMWWEALGMEEPAGDQPLWATQTTNERTGLDTWRCKECHGWDYAGFEGAYGSGSHATGFPGVLGAASQSPDEILAWLNGSTNPDHDFSAMDEVARNALIRFLREEVTDITPYVNIDGTVNGDPAHGRELFEGTCAACHGTDGKRMNFGDADEPEFIGTVAADNPWEFFHKASFGQPGQPMPAGRALGWSLQDIADVLSYAQTLPTE